MSETIIKDVEQFDIIGSVEVTNKIASGFSVDSYLKLNKWFIPENNSWEIVLKVTFGSRSCFFFGNTNGYYSIVLGRSNSANGGKLVLYLSSNGSSWDISSGLGDLVLDDNTEYYIKLSYDLTDYKLEASTDGSNWQTSTSITSALKVYQGLYYIGACWDRSTSYLDGSVDLTATETYINVNNQLYWKPYVQKTYTYTDYEVQVLKGMVSTFGVRANGKYDSLVSKRITSSGEITSTLLKDYDGLYCELEQYANEPILMNFSNTILPWKWEYSYLLKNNLFSMLPYGTDYTHFYDLYGNVIRNGNITLDINSGECSNFSKYNSITLPESFDPQNYNTWEIFLKFKHSTNLSYQRLTGAPNNTTLCQVVIGVDNNKLKIWMSSNGTSYDLLNGISGVTSLTNNTTYYVKATFNGTEYNFQLSTDGHNWTTEIYLSSSTKVNSNNDRFFLGMSEFSNYLAGTLYLKECYIKTDGNYWWQPICKKTYTNKITVNGSSSSNYLKYNLKTGILDVSANQKLVIPNVFEPQNSSWEIGIKFKTPSSFNRANLLLGGNDYFITPACEVNSNGRFAFGVSSNGTSWSLGSTSSFISGSVVLTTNTWYYAKMIFNGHSYLSYISTNGIDWSLNTQLDSDIIQYQDGDKSLQIGNTASDTNRYYQGQIDVSYCYIKFDNEYIWKPDYEETTVYLGCLDHYIDDGSAVTLNCYAVGDDRIVLSDINYNGKYLGTIDIPAHTVYNPS